MADDVPRPPVVAEQLAPHHPPYGEHLLEILVDHDVLAGCQHHWDVGRGRDLWDVKKQKPSMMAARYCPKGVGDLVGKRAWQFSFAGHGKFSFAGHSFYESGMERVAHMHTPCLRLT